jgi:thiamine-phosphate pyrophosphorylase
MKKKIGRLHVLTDTGLQNRFSHQDLARLAVEGGAEVIQFREKRGETRYLIDTAIALKEICSRSGALLIVNDRVDVALASGADGVHLGREDFPIGPARRLLGAGKIIGASADSVEEALECMNQGADYVGFGPVFPTTSKEDAGPVTGLQALSLVVEAVEIPVIAIGGINRGNAPAVVRAGAYGVAVISAVCCQEDPAAAARGLLEAISRQGSSGDDESRGRA